jgi:hypothetical protein
LPENSPPTKFAADSLVPLRIEGYEKDWQAKAKVAVGQMEKN